MSTIPEWLHPGSYSFWLLPGGNLDLGGPTFSPLIVLFHEWQEGDAWGLSLCGGYWMWIDGGPPRDEEGRKGSLDGGYYSQLQNHVLCLEDHRMVAALIERGKLKRIGELPDGIIERIIGAGRLDLGPWDDGRS